VTANVEGQAAIDLVRPRFKSEQRWPFKIDANTLASCKGFIDR